MKRELAIEIIVRNKLKKISNNEREELIFDLLDVGYDELEGWQKIDKEIRKEFQLGSLLFEVYSSRYDKVLLLILTSQYDYVGNELLIQESGVKEITGSPKELECCPCCGYQTIIERGIYQICMICWWEDDGNDNNSSKNSSGPNYGISLMKARYNFIKYGIYDPKRNDLLSKRENIKNYKCNRFFKIIEEKYIMEEGTNWKEFL